MSLLGEPDAPEAFCEFISMNVLKTTSEQPTTQKVSFPMLLPHQMFAYLYAHHRRRFNDIFLNGSDSAETLPDFWAQSLARRDPRLKHHVMAERPGWKKCAVPFMVHGDAVPCISVGKAGSKSFDCYSWQGVLGVGNSKELKLLMFGLFEANKIADGDSNTMAEIWVVIKWSLESLLSGVWPACDHRGARYRKGTPEGDRANSPLAGSYFGVLWCLKADLDHWPKYGLRRYSCDRCCQFCNGDKGADVRWRWNYFGADAKWKANLLSAAEWRNLYDEMHPLFQLPNVSNDNIEADELHIVHMGTSAYIAGSVLWMLCYELLPQSPQKNLESVWMALVEEYQACGVTNQYTNLGLGSFCDPTKPRAAYPKLKGRGAEIKDLMRPLLATWSKCMDASVPEHKVIEVLLSSQCKAQEILDDYSQDAFLPVAEADAFMGHIDDILKAYSIVARWADVRKVLLFSVVPKFHWYWHLGHRAKFLCPRKGNCMLDEDYMGACKDLVRSCAHGTESHNVPLSLMEKYRFALHFLNRYGNEYVGPE